MGKYAIFLVLSLIFGLIVFGQSIRENLYASQLEMIETQRYNEAKNIAKTMAGVAIRKIKEKDPSFIPGGSSSISPVEGDWYNIIDAPSNSNSTKRYTINVSNQGDTLLTIVSAGIIESVSYADTVEMNKTSNFFNWPLMPYAVYTRGGINISGGAKIIGDAATGSQEGVTVEDVTVNGGTEIKGSLSIGPNADIESTVHYPSWVTTEDQKKRFINDGVGHLPSVPEYDLPKFPDFPPINPENSSAIERTGNDNSPISVSEYKGKYLSNLTLDNNVDINIYTNGEDQVIHVGNLDIRNGNLNVIGGGTVKFMVENDITFASGSNINTQGEQNQVFTYYKGSKKLNFAGGTDYNGNLFIDSADLELSGGGGLNGHIISGGNNVEISGGYDANSRVIYAPDSDIIFSGGGNLTGSVIGQSFTASGGISVNFSSETGDLPELAGDDSGGSFQFKAWY